MKLQLPPSVFFIFSVLLGLSGIDASASEAGSEFVPIFDGESLEGWTGDPRLWRIEAGEIVGQTTADAPGEENSFLIWEGGRPSDFELKIEFEIRSGNSGIQYRSFPLKGREWGVGGYRADISADHEWTGAAYGERYKGMLARRGEKVVVGAEPGDHEVVAQLGEGDEILSYLNEDGWNEYHIIARGNQVIQLLNCVVTAEFSDSSPSRLRGGLIALQLHSGTPMEVRFRNIRLREVQPEETTQILFLAGPESHGYGAHEHKAGSLLLARSLNESGLDISAQVITGGAWPEPWHGYDQPDAVVMYCDGLDRHLARAHQDKIAGLVASGVGIACLHFAVEVAPEQLGSEFLDWIGGYFEAFWSVNPHWTAEFANLPEHSITRGVEPFVVRDEWYYHMRFRPDMENVTPILTALPPLESLTRRAGDLRRGSNPAVMAEVKAGNPQVLAWTYERPTGGRGFGFTGGHFHQNWKDDDFRTLVLNALLWTAGVEVPENGLVSRTPSDKDMELNQDFSRPNRSQ